jgi:hypothetical protein
VKIIFYFLLFWINAIVFAQKLEYPCHLKFDCKNFSEDCNVFNKIFDVSICGHQLINKNGDINKYWWEDSKVELFKYNFDYKTLKQDNQIVVEVENENCFSLKIKNKISGKEMKIYMTQLNFNINHGGYLYLKNLKFIEGLFFVFIDNFPLGQSTPFSTSVVNFKKAYQYDSKNLKYIDFEDIENFRIKKNELYVFP